jgi:hypothetical protein
MMTEWEKHGVLEFCYPPCGGVARFDEGSGFGYRCEDCNAVLGSIGQPSSCREEALKYENWKTLGGKGWDFFKGCEEK